MVGSSGMPSQYPAAPRPLASSAVPSEFLQRTVLLGPDAVARQAARFAPDAEARWMLAQPREVRRSYVGEVLDRDQQDLREQMWMLSQGDAVRGSYVRDVLAPRLAAAPGR